jgi:hypothetical protein
LFPNPSCLSEKIALLKPPKIGVRWIVASIVRCTIVGTAAVVALPTDLTSAAAGVAPAWTSAQVKSGDDPGGQVL